MKGRFGETVLCEIFRARTGKEALAGTESSLRGGRVFRREAGESVLRRIKSGRHEAKQGSG